jgi:hypothetical protein
MQFANYASKQCGRKEIFLRSGRRIRFIIIVFKSYVLIIMPKATDKTFKKKKENEKLALCSVDDSATLLV